VLAVNEVETPKGKGYEVLCSKNAACEKKAKRLCKGDFETVESGRVNEDDMRLVVVCRSGMLGSVTLIEGEKRVDSPTQGAPGPRAPADAPLAGTPSTPFPERVAGFSFGLTVQGARDICVSAAGEFKQGMEVPQRDWYCTRVPEYFFPGSESVYLRFCGDGEKALCDITLKMRHLSEDDERVSRGLLVKKYGPGQSGDDTNDRIGFVEGGPHVAWRWLNVEQLEESRIVLRTTRFIDNGRWMRSYTSVSYVNKTGLLLDTELIAGKKGSY
jgi:hypothetical protein